ncbi:hypothetical protein M3697_08895 [Janibacter melonis]|uniref:hypothetical protein n=1 Tax=Janibacter melonis TaxID=262209 RepID=UPI00204394FD|nr:hypothetical protein [Janibacter melonis]MCM3555222.1 hypothetical protein [Janibacter melonis]
MRPEDRERALRELDRVLGAAGYRPLAAPLTIGGVPFDVTRAYAAGAGFLDLVIVVDATEGSSKQFQRGYWLIERIARALDQAESRRPLTVVVLHDEAAARVNTEDFLRLGRVLLLTDPARVEVELAPMLPIVLEPTAEAFADPLEDLLKRHSGGQDGSSKAALIEAAKASAESVESALLGWIEGAFAEKGATDDGSSA